MSITTEPAAPVSTANILGHMSSTWTAVGFVLGAIAPLVVNQTMPTTSAGWIMELALLATAVIKALGR